MRVVVVGAGISGLVAARTLADHGCAVQVFERADQVGGRMATRALAGARVDEGAQFFTVRTDPFRQRVDEWQRRHLVTVWCRGFTADDGHARYVAAAGMASLAEDLADGLDVRLGAMAFAVRRTTEHPASWALVTDDGVAHDADALVVTTPLPQTFALLADSGLELDEELLRTDYDRTIAWMAVLDRPPAVPAPGGLQTPGPDVAFVADSVAKGLGGEPGLTLHASAVWSLEHWDDHVEARARALEDLARPWLGDAVVVDAVTRRWRFATPQVTHRERCWCSADGRVVLAGDAFAGPRVEGAHNSGLAAAEAVLQRFGIG